MMNKKFIALSMLMFASWQGRLMSSSAPKGSVGRSNSARDVASPASPKSLTRTRSNSLNPLSELAPKAEPTASKPRTPESRLESESSIKFESEAAPESVSLGESAISPESQAPKSMYKRGAESREYIEKGSLENNLMEVTNSTSKSDAVASKSRSEKGDKGIEGGEYVANVSGRKITDTGKTALEREFTKSETSGVNEGIEMTSITKPSADITYETTYTGSQSIMGSNPMRTKSALAEPQATEIVTLSAVPEAQVVSQQKSWFRNPFSRSKTTSSEQAGKTIENVSQSEPVVAEPITQMKKDYKTQQESIFLGKEGKVDLANQLSRPTEPKIDSKSKQGKEYREFLSGTSYASLGSKLTGELSNGYTSKSQVITDIANKMLLDMRIPESVLTSPRFVSRQWNAIKSNFSKEVEVANQQTNQQTRLSKISQAMSNFGQSISQYVSSMFGKEVTTNTKEVTTNTTEQRKGNKSSDRIISQIRGDKLIDTNGRQYTIDANRVITDSIGNQYTLTNNTLTKVSGTTSIYDAGFGKKGDASLRDLFSQKESKVSELTKTEAETKVESQETDLDA